MGDDVLHKVEKNTDNFYVAAWFTVVVTLWRHSSVIFMIIFEHEIALLWVGGFWGLCFS